ncbi:3-oxo-5-alpha-steroid 4-dehydrogenase (NADP(+)) protein [Dioscorea alata]|uniref:3-oxo-5-alpha-steroid 4-dehydrogenase (NADP(+)) protein n=1 Tax=Dioscorea alata TaxID=55571 RepID=A0ACB7VG27_DIOAL|nr:3-oxo-5-alpha-steroid 4-dehydrogenase (NADP(+)) protein [Dioscorea alata]
MAWDDEKIFSKALISLYIMCPLTILSLHFLTAPYGKHARSGWGPTLPPCLAWFLMESPTLWLTVLLYPLGRYSSHPLSLIVISLYLLHYTHRTLIYPLRLLSTSTSKSNLGFPLSIAFFAFSFNLLNAYLQARSASHYAGSAMAEDGWRLWFRVAAGMAVFFLGMRVNIRADLALVKLKKEGGGYKIPRGGWFEFVSCPNYMGEALEWLGWAIVAWSPASWAFFLYTCSNLGPRARAHHKWYCEKFGSDYPSSRKAIVPFFY